MLGSARPALPRPRAAARVGVERLEESGNPALITDRMRRLYQQRGDSAEWIDQRMQGIVVRDELTT
jgi:hypothetical protein